MNKANILPIIHKVYFDSGKLLFIREFHLRTVKVLENHFVPTVP
jgi:hypothetical protein